MKISTDSIGGAASNYGHLMSLEVKIRINLIAAINSYLTPLPEGSNNIITSLYVKDLFQEDAAYQLAIKFAQTYYKSLGWKRIEFTPQAGDNVQVQMSK